MCVYSVVYTSPSPQLQTLPAAHIKGSGTLWNATDGKYMPQWDCKSSALGTAFVTGGMWFNQHDKSLYVPECGWYYVTSQVTFQSNSEPSQKYSHTLRIDRNCDATATPLVTSSYSHTTFTMTGPLDKDTSGKSSTVVSDMVKICTRGRIYVSILTSNSACCPYGSETATMITAYLVQETDCFWPVTSSSHPIEQFQKTTP